MKGYQLSVISSPLFALHRLNGGHETRISATKTTDN
jgi:hypothetical protein